MLRNLSRILVAKASFEAAKRTFVTAADAMLTRAYKNRHPKRTRRTASFAALPATALGAAMMYLFDPQKGAERRSTIQQSLSRARSTEVKQKVHEVQERSKHVIDLAAKKAKRSNETEEQQPAANDV